MQEMTYEGPDDGSFLNLSARGAEQAERRMAIADRYKTFANYQEATVLAPTEADLGIMAEAYLREQREDSVGRVHGVRLLWNPETGETYVENPIRNHRLDLELRQWEAGFYGFIGRWDKDSDVFTCEMDERFCHKVIELANAELCLNYRAAQGRKVVHLRDFWIPKFEPITVA